MHQPHPLLRGSSDENDINPVPISHEPLTPPSHPLSPSIHVLGLQSISGLTPRRLQLDFCNEDLRFRTYPCNNTKLDQVHSHAYTPAYLDATASLALCILVFLVAIAGCGLSYFISTVEEKVSYERGRVI